MTDKETITQLEALKAYCEAEAKNRGAEENIWIADVKALDNAIKHMKGTM